MDSAEVIKSFTDLGGTLGSLLACFWYIKYMTSQHQREREQWMEKDTEADRAILEIVRESNTVLGDLRSTLSEHTEVMRTMVSTFQQRLAA